MQSDIITLDFEDKLSLPEDVSIHTIGEKTLFIDVQQPSWVALENPETEALRRLLRGATIGDAFDAIRSYGYSDEVSAKYLQALLTKVNNHSFQKQSSTRKKDYFTIQVHLTNRCNIRCSHCYVESGKPFNNELGKEDWIEIIKAVAAYHENVHLSISGGEPLTVPWLLDFVEEAYSQFGCSISMLTNAMLWTNEFAKKVSPYLEQVSVSFDGSTEEVHDKIRGHGAYKKALKGLYIIAENGIPITLNMTLMRSNRENLLNNMVSFVDGLPFMVNVEIANYILEGRGLANTHEPLTHKEFVTTLNIITPQLLRGNFVPSKIAKRSNCGYGTSLAIYANGSVSPCLTPRFIQGNFLKTNATEIVEGIMRGYQASLVDKLPLCKSCDLRYLCGGRCHLSQLTKSLPISQNECLSSYRQNFYLGLIDQFERQQKSFDSIVNLISV
ncbi:radical SAM/SPASM domain-containing protein [Fibrivirga algicola]|uniref:Radical SAM protein n=1 Tax=Fibrivirga algicola TaxID=2950420 RepID=A0ABX0QQS0_9BACT|nr:radical SAM protein [Fibrivirga algicola]NID13500.1 radical SAM protein [Fibrivirga algicola]